MQYCLVSCIHYEVSFIFEIFFACKTVPQMKVLCSIVTCKIFEKITWSFYIFNCKKKQFQVVNTYTCYLLNLESTFGAYAVVLYTRLEEIQCIKIAGKVPLNKSTRSRIYACIYRKYTAWVVDYLDRCGQPVFGDHLLTYYNINFGQHQTNFILNNK